EGDRLFYFVYETGDGAADKQASEWLSEPLWQNLNVVKAGKAYAVDDAIWNTAGGYIAANLLLDDIARAFDVTLAK
ncbi:MAG: iron siderophore-binding protein, partial [Devosia nanyangense]|nr:iron siderophore-binding protein [Devosia nanyangense]